LILSDFLFKEGWAVQKDTFWTAPGIDFPGSNYTPMQLSTSSPKPGVKSSYKRGDAMNTALLIVDIQNDYFPGGKNPLEGSPEAAQQARRLLEYFRRLPCW
jgi:hypothetical protein